MISGRGHRRGSPPVSERAMASTPSQATCRWMAVLASRRLPASADIAGTVFDQENFDGHACSPLAVMTSSHFPPRQSERWNRAQVWSRPRCARMLLDDLLADGQSDAGAGERFPFVQPLNMPNIFSKYCGSIPSPLSCTENAHFFRRPRRRRCGPSGPGPCYLMALRRGF